MGATIPECSRHLPLLHLTGGNVDSLRLTTAAHGEVDIECGQTMTKVALGNDVECGGVVQDVVVEGEITAEESSR